jgi:hypothetical protein
MALTKNKLCSWLSIWWPETFAVTLGLIFAVSIPLQAWFLPPTRAYAGFVQLDQPVYYACARETFERGNGVFYANPYSNDPNSPRIYSHFCFLLIGWFWRLTGISFTAIDGAIRILFGPLMLLLAAAIYRRIHPRDSLTGWGAAALLCSGGFAWLGGGINTIVDYLLLDSNRPVQEGFFAWVRHMYLTEFFWAESGYGDWHVTLFRNLFYSPEVLYHILFFVSVLGFLSRKWVVGTIALFLTWWSHPYTGLQLNLIVGAWLALEWWQRRSIPLSALVANALIGLTFVGYYGVFLSRFPEHVSTLKQMRGFGAIMLPERMLWAYGAFLLLPFGYFRSPQFRQDWSERPEIRFVVIWLGISLFLNLHDKLLPFLPSMQPLHFSHGYLAMPLVILSVSSLRVWDTKWRAAGLARRGAVVAAILFILHMPDNVIWSLRVIPRLPQASLVFAPVKEEMELLKRLEALPSTETIMITSAPLFVGAGTQYLLPVFTHHNGLLCHFFNTPYVQAKQELVDAFRKAPSRELLQKAGITAILTNRKYWQDLQTSLTGVTGPVLLEYQDAILGRVQP